MSGKNEETEKPEQDEVTVVTDERRRSLRQNRRNSFEEFFPKRKSSVDQRLKPIDEEKELKLNKRSRSNSAKRSPKKTPPRYRTGSVDDSDIEGLSKSFSDCSLSEDELSNSDKKAEKGTKKVGDSSNKEVQKSTKRVPKKPAETATTADQPSTDSASSVAKTTEISIQPSAGGAIKKQSVGQNKTPLEEQSVGKAIGGSEQILDVEDSVNSSSKVEEKLESSSPPIETQTNEASDNSPGILNRFFHSLINQPASGTPIQRVSPLSNNSQVDSGLASGGKSPTDNRDDTNSALDTVEQESSSSEDKPSDSENRGNKPKGDNSVAIEIEPINKTNQVENNTTVNLDLTANATFNESFVSAVGENDSSIEDQDIKNEQEVAIEMALTSTQYVEIIPKITDASNSEQFISIVDTLYENVPEESKPIFLMIVKAKILGKAYNAIKGKAAATWEEIKRALVAGLEDKIDPAMASNKLVQIRQKKEESLRDYVARIKEALAELNKVSLRSNENTEVQKHVLTLNDATAKSTFESGLFFRNLKTIVIAAQKTTFIESYSFAINQEQTNFPEMKFEKNTMNKKERSPKREITCFKCGKRGHIAPECYSGRNSYNGKSASYQKNNTGWNKNSQNNDRDRYQSGGAHASNSAQKTNNDNNQHKPYNANYNRDSGNAYRNRDNGKQNKYENKNFRMVKGEDVVDWDEISPIDEDFNVQKNE